VITVKPVNDVPTELSIIQENRDYYEGQAQPAYGNATDADLPYGDLLNFTWSFNTSDRVLWGPEVDLSLPAGKHKVILLVSDSENQTARISINITILGINVDDDDADDDDTDDDVSDDDSDDDVDDDIGDDDADDDVGGEEDKDSKDSMMVYIVMGGILLLIITTIIIVLIFFILGGRKRKMDENGVDNDKPTEALIGIEPSLPPVEKELSYDLDYSEIHTQENLYDEMENVGDQQTYHKESPLPQKSSAFEDKFQFQHESLAGVDGEMECLPEACSMESAEPVEDHMPQVSSDDISLEEYTIEGNWSKDVAVVSSENLSGVDDTGSNHEDILEELLRVY